MKRLICHGCLWLFVFTCHASALFETEEPRLYSGSIEVPTLGELNMVIGISETDEGTYILLTVPSQGAKNIPLDATYQVDGALSAELPQAGLSFTVKENETQTTLTGHMEQGLTFPIEFTRVDSIPEFTRPQNPVGPFPYSEREVTALHPSGHLIAGTLTTPKGNGPFPCAVLISGSGMQDRDESLMGHKPFLVIADYLTRNGIAVLRFDDRGVGGSVVENDEDITLATSEDFATDVAVMVEAARMHPSIDSKRVGVIGHSEGGLIGPMVAVNDDTLAFVIMLAGPGVAGNELLPVQLAMLAQSNGAEQELIDVVVHESMSLYEMMEVGANDEELREQMALLVAAQCVITEVEISEEDIANAIDQGLETMRSPWMQFFLFYDPAPVLSQITCPVLAMNGTLDVQVSSKQNLPAIEMAMTNAVGALTIVELDGLNHLFQPATSGSVSEYSVIETTFDQGALEKMSEWLMEVTDVD